MIPVMVTTPSQVGKTVALAIVNKEDTTVHKEIFVAVKEAIEKCVNDLLKEGFTHI